MKNLNTTLEYLQSLADNSEEGYFYIDMDKVSLELDMAKRTLYNHLGKLSDKVFKVYNGTFSPDGLPREILRDSGRNIKTLSSLYYIPRGIFDSQFKRDIAILRYCFGWADSYLKHYIWWADAEHMEYDEELTGLSMATICKAEQYFKYIVHAHFEFDNDEAFELLGIV